MKNKTFDSKIQNSKFDFCKQFKFALILPILIVIVGIVLALTLGFNFDNTLKGYTSIKVCANSNGNITSAENRYKLDGKLEEGDLDYAALKEDITSVLKEFGQKPFAFSKTTMNLGTHADEPAVEVRFDYVGGKDKAETDEFLSQIQTALQNKFGYTDAWSGAVGDAQVSKGYQDGSFLMYLLIGIIVSLVLAFAYLAFRFDLAAAFSIILATFVDLLIMLSCTVICRIPVGTSIAAVVVATILISLYNNIVVFGRLRENRKSGVYQAANGERSAQFYKRLANISIKETLLRTLVTCFVLLGLLVLLIAFGATSVQMAALPLLFATISTFFTSMFLTPTLWSIAFKPKKEKIAK